MSSPDNINYPENSDKSIVSEISYNSESVYSNARNAHIDKRDELNRRLEERERDDDMYISELEQKIEALNLKISQITKEIKIEQATRDEEALEYKEKIQKYKDNIIALSEKKEISIRAAENEHKRLLQEFERGMTERNTEIADLQLQLVQYKQESQDYASDIKKLISYNNELTSKVVSTEQSELNRHIQTLENQNTELNKQVQVLQEKLIELTKPQSSSNSPSPESSQRGLHPFLNHNLENSLLGRGVNSTTIHNGESPFTGNSRLQDNHAQINFIMDQMRSPSASPFQTLHGTNFQPGQTYQQEMSENLEQKIASLEQQLEYAKQNEEYSKYHRSQLLTY
jgi:chromosome segregation ATPase